MFTGIVEEIGTVVSLTKSNDIVLWDDRRGEGWVLVIKCKVALEGAYLGCSIAVNGTCLTVTAFDNETFTVGCAPETMRLTNLIDLTPGSPVNIERSMSNNDRNSGHFVQGHVDGTGEILEKWMEGDSLWVKVKAPEHILRYIVPKGYCSIDGTSLTVCEVNRSESWFTFMLIEYTQKHIIIPKKNVGERVNLEADVLGKYVDRATGSILEAFGALEKKITTALDAFDKRVSNLEARLPPS